MSPSLHFHSQLLPHLLLFAAVTHLLILGLGAIGEKHEQSISRLGCPDKCGDISIPFPFGFGDKPGCFLEGFEVTCNYSFNPPRAFLAYRGLSQSIWRYAYSENLVYDMVTENTSVPPFELVGISADMGEVQVYGPVASTCNTNATESFSIHVTTNFEDMFDPDGKRPFLLSTTRNVLVGVGWATAASFSSIYGLGVGNNYDLNCNADFTANLRYATNGSCSRQGCCQASFPEAAPLNNTQLSVTGADNNTLWETNPCSYAMVAESSWYNFSTPDLYGFEVLPKMHPRGVPYVLDFAIRSGSCPADGQQPREGYDACVSDNSRCANATNGPGYVCKCLDHYQGNPYITGGCQDINECEFPDLYPCSSDGVCKNKPGGYDCPCKGGKKGDGKTGTCANKVPLAEAVVIGAIGGIFFIAIVTLVVLFRKEKQRIRELYEKNGGTTLENANNIKLFKKEELKPILKSNNFIGRGGFGEVYKGSLRDIGLVAVKKPISGNVLENKQFANEIIIQSQVIHRNIVKLIGCCLEVDVPMLVYEFLSRGSLHDILHEKPKAPLDLDMRLLIAAESADGLAYMHSSAHTTIIHGDVKPANILLDVNFAPKISDFGISRLTVRDKDHTDTVIGDINYMDPVYKNSGRLTAKSDVYSFGVVILELISRQKATHSDDGGLVCNFLEAYKENISYTLFDEEFTAPRDLEILNSLAEIALECLVEPNVDQRPSMAQVAERLSAMYEARKPATSRSAES